MSKVSDTKLYTMVNFTLCEFHLNFKKEKQKVKINSPR